MSFIEETEENFIYKSIKKVVSQSQVEIEDIEGPQIPITHVVPTSLESVRSQIVHKDTPIASGDFKSLTLIQGLTKMKENPLALNLS